MSYAHRTEDCSHCTGSAGRAKRAYRSERDARDSADWIRRHRGAQLRAYACPWGEGWHLTSDLGGWGW